MIRFDYRNSLGRNDNPNAIDFKSAYQKLLVCHPIITSRDTNTITNATGILTASAHKKRIPQDSVYTRSEEFDLNIDYDQLMVQEISTMDSYEQHLCAYIALRIEQQFKQKINRNLYDCKDCASILCSLYERINDDLLAMKNEDGPAQQPLASTLKIVIFANAVMKQISAQSSQGNDFRAVCKTAYNNLNMDDLYSAADFSHLEGETIVNHKEKFIFEVIRQLIF